MKVHIMGQRSRCTEEGWKNKCESNDKPRSLAALCIVCLVLFSTFIYSPKVEKEGGSWNIIWDKDPI
jgi:hypothetical protein